MTDEEKQRQADEAAQAAKEAHEQFAPHGTYTKGSHHYPIAGHVPSPTIRPRPISRKPFGCFEPD